MGNSFKIATKPWNDWYHCTCNTYGTWLRGDPRGWRARHHREHVNGDYKNPPPKGKYDSLHEQSRRLMKRLPVHVRRELRQFVLDAFVEKLQSQGAQVIAACLDDHHLHVLARFPDHKPRTHVGWAKYHATKAPKAQPQADSLGMNLGEGLWAKRGKCIPITDRAHQVQCFHYILKHARRRAGIWHLKRVSPTA